MNREELLRAMSEIDANYIEEAAPPDDTGEVRLNDAERMQTNESEKVQANPKKVLTFRRIAPLGGLVAACLVAVISISTLQNVHKSEAPEPEDTVSMSAQNQENEVAQEEADMAADYDEIGAPAGAEERQDSAEIQGNTMIANPFTEYESLEAMIEAAGIDLTVPEAVVPYTVLSYDAIPDDLVEVIYYDDEGNEGYRIRKGIGDEDISGDYNEYDVVEQVEMDGTDVTLKGDGETVNTAIWTADGCTYAIDADGYAFTKEKIIELIKGIK